MGKINFFKEDIFLKTTPLQPLKSWVISTAKSENHLVEEINYIFCSDEYLLTINQEYLQHDYYTDIITFNNSSEPKHLISDIFISVDRVKENAQLENVDFHNELARVMIHGLLHLCGYTDTSPKDKKQMREKEDHYLSLLPKN